MRVTVQHNIDIVRRSLRRNVLQTKLLSAAGKIDNQRPLVIAVAISAHNRHRRTNRAQLIQNAFRANIAEMPNLIRVLRQDRQFLRETCYAYRREQKTRVSHFKRISQTKNTTDTKVAAQKSFVILCVLCVSR